MNWGDRHGWVPFVHGSDGLTGRERRAYAKRYAATIGNRNYRPPSTADLGAAERMAAVLQWPCLEFVKDTPEDPSTEGETE